MSDISAVNGEPFEVRPAGEGKGLGCFATRDIRAGETVLVTHSPIIWEDVHTADERVDLCLALYESVDEETRRGWAGLASSDHEIKERLERSLRRRRPDGTFFNETERDFYLHILMALENNCFGVEDEVGDETQRSGLFIEASRFNHSCDPNMDYTCNWRKRRWVGRATRDVREGEELLITYTPIHRSTLERRCGTAMWCFVCECTRCISGEDTYTYSLSQALAVAKGVQPNATPQSRFTDISQEEENRVHDRVRFLRELREQEEKNGVDVKWRLRELAFALWDASQFHRQRLWFWMDLGRDVDEMTRTLTIDIVYCQEALKFAKATWPETHELIKTARMHLRTGLRIWEQSGLGRGSWEATGAPEDEDEDEAPADVNMEGETDVDSDKENRAA